MLFINVFIYWCSWEPCGWDVGINLLNKVNLVGELMEIILWSCMGIVCVKTCVWERSITYCTFTSSTFPTLLFHQHHYILTRGGVNLVEAAPDARLLVPHPSGESGKKRVHICGLQPHLSTVTKVIQITETYIMECCKMLCIVMLSKFSCKLQLVSDLVPKLLFESTTWNVSLRFLGQPTPCGTFS